MKNLSKVGLALIKKHESFVDKLYSNDGAVGGNCTVGYGHLVHYGPCDQKQVSEKPYLKGTNDETASKLLSNDVATAVNAVNKYVTVELTQNEFDALVSLTYNIGARAFRHSTLLNLINNGVLSKKDTNTRQRITNAFLMWSKANGHYVKGLENRRKDESKFFLGE